METGLILACLTCCESLQSAIFDGHFAGHLLRIGLPVIGGGLLVTALVRRSLSSRPGKAEVAAAGTLLGIGLGGFVDGIVLHQMLQWHQMFSNLVHPTTVEAKNINMFWDGRHTTGSTLSDLGAGQKVIGAALGHRDSKATGRYVHAKASQVAVLTDARWERLTKGASTPATPPAT